jgi:ABC-type antimicrobial peptide transport system permease subunit
LSKSPEQSSVITNGIRALTYLVNLIRAGDRTTPYSMVTAIDTSVLTTNLGDDEILINDWLAEDLNVRPGGTIELSYYVLDAGAQLIERTNTFRVAGIVPMTGLYADRTLMPEFPGLAKAESTHDWDAGFKLVHEIRAKDEDYWKKHRGTPKAFVTLGAGQKMWANRFGNLTAIRWPASGRDASLQPMLSENLRANLQLAQIGFRLEPVRDRALKAAEQSQDFGGLFLGFSFFLIVAALLLMALLFRFGIEQRAAEVGTFLALGFTPRQVRRLLLFEGGALAFFGGIAGMLGGVWYAKAMLNGLTTVWREAVAGSALEFHVEPLTLLIGAVSSIAVAWITVGIALRDQARRTARELLSEGAADRMDLQAPAKRKRRVASLLGMITAVGAVGMVAWSVMKGDTANAGTFFTAGTLLLIAGLSLVAAVLARLRDRTSKVQDDFDLSGLGVRNCSRRRSRSLATVSLLACGSFLIASIGAFRLDAVRDAHERSSGTGGFALIGESALPVVQDLNSRSGQEFFGLDANDLEAVSVVPVRVREGEDASCLNLNRAQRPRLLGVGPGLLGERGAFRFAKTIRDTPARSPWTLIEQASPPASVTTEDIVPAIGDEASILWAMGKKVGDTLDYIDERGNPFKVQIVGAVANSILQGNLLIDEKNFIRLFPSESGYRMFLIDAPSKSVTNVSTVLSRAMRDVGLELTLATVRLSAFNAVQNTYLGTFQTLGGLGLLLGSAGLGVVVLRNVLDRRSELAVLSAVGLRSRAVRWLVLSEHGALLLAGLGIGVISAVMTVLPMLLSPGANVPYASLVITLAAVLVSGALWTWVATRIALRGRMLDALRNE